MKLFFLILLPASVFCQTYTLTGSVKDTANTPIPLVNIFTSIGEGTLTNENGEFVLKVSALPVQITVSHVSFQAISLKISEEKILNIVLREGIKTLPETTVGNYALELIKKATDKTRQDSIYRHFGRGFYRRIQKESDKYTLLQEIFFDAKISSAFGFEAILPTASRYTFHDGNVENKFMFLYTLRHSSPGPPLRFRNDKEGLLPLSDYAKFYTFEVENYINPDSPNEIAVVLCKPKEKSNFSFEGRFYIRTSTNGVLRIKGRRYTGKQNYTKNFWFKVKEAYFDFDINYLEKDEHSVLSGIDLDYVLNVQYASSVIRPIIEHVSLVMYDFSVPKDDSEKNLKTIVMQEDQLFATTQESTEFWENNPIIKRTPLEDEVIKAFEKKKKKGGNMIFPTQK
ncbi:carboxypeptidase-like regulatory domain-containing protein [Runella salmonicolor]|uniref:Carboxypeptidase-like regulatory domain-containing protein n=1 Tax=Runella salmonicolor TaxID=2950278 RepID=A0ABT1FW80_9BACT|nr:carboxypeptidase-like regulatory domain-containing protein [Runella salmonicolor]MCP1384933.1 carboxypeptidase-like regulatory domain-containing protein [Runella salmonicolor]